MTRLLTPVLLLLPLLGMAPPARAGSEVTVAPAVLAPGGTAVIRYQPAAGEDGAEALRSVHVHYGFNGWNLQTAEPDAGSEDDTGNRNWYVRRSMRLDPATGAWQAEVALPAGARALHMAFCWNECGSGQWDNNGRRDYARPLVFPYIGPLLAWNERTHPATGVVVTVEHPAAETVWIEYWREGEAPVRREVAGEGVRRFELAGLRPDTRYRYRVGAGEALSAEYAFKTAKAFQGVEPVRFAVFGDAQDNGESGRLARIAHELAARHDDLDFVLSTGDLPWNDKPGDWWAFFDKTRELFARRVVMPAVGNHDTPGVTSHRDLTSFNRYFPVPEGTPDRAHYRFAFGPAEFYAMNSERPDELTAPDGAQYRWLRAQLRDRAAMGGREASAWTFAYWHIPPFNAGARHWGQQYAFRGVAELFQGVVDWHFGGHEHLYQRMHPLTHRGGTVRVRGAYGRGAGEGVGYLVVPSAGVPPGTGLVGAAERPELRSLLAFPRLDPSRTDAGSWLGFSRVELTGAAIDLKVYSVPDHAGEAQVVDRVRYAKAAP